METNTNTTLEGEADHPNADLIPEMNPAAVPGAPQLEPGGEFPDSGPQYGEYPDQPEGMGPGWGYAATEYQFSVGEEVLYSPTWDEPNLEVWSVVEYTEKDRRYVVKSMNSQTKRSAHPLSVVPVPVEGQLIPSGIFQHGTQVYYNKYAFMKFTIMKADPQKDLYEISRVDVNDEPYALFVSRAQMLTNVEAPRAQRESELEDHLKGRGCWKGFTEDRHLKCLFLTLSIIACAVCGTVLPMMGNQEMLYIHIGTGIFYILYIIENECSSTCQYVDTLSDTDGARKHLDKIFRREPCIAWSIQCYHYETRTRVVTVSDGKGGTTTRLETYTERVNTHYASTSYDFACWRDVSHGHFDVDSYTLTKIRFEKKYSFANDYTRRHFYNCKDRFIYINDRDTHYDFYENFTIQGFIPRMMAEFMESTNTPSCLSPTWFRIAYIFLGSFPYRCWLSAITGKVDYTVRKEINALPFFPGGGDVTIIYT